MRPPSTVTATVDLSADGKHFGLLQIPRSSNLSGWAKLSVPIISVKNGTGPSALVLGGNHGDEYEGQIALLNLAREIQPHQVTGHLVMIPCLSMAASRDGTRLWPDGSNFNRSFPGDPIGPEAQQLADYLTRELFAKADLVVDIHSGGRSMRFAPMSHMHWIDNPEQRRLMVEGMLAWNTPFHMLYADVAGAGLLPSEAERQGKIVVTTELGGGGYIAREIHELARSGLLNVLRHFGVLQGDPIARRTLNLPEPIIISALDSSGYLFAPESGLFETLVDPGDSVHIGQPVGRIHFPERPDRAAVTVNAPFNGRVACVRAIVPTQQGDCLAVVGQEVRKEDIL